MKVLIAEDDLATLQMVSTLVESWGYEVSTAENGEDAVRQLKESNAPRLAILDWEMPLMSGLEVVETLRKVKSEQYTYVLLLTAESKKDRLLEALRSGCDDYITKPFSLRELEARLFVGKRIVLLQQQLAEALQTAQYQGSHDALTGAFNRGSVLQFLARELARALRQGDQLAVMLLDVDHFKLINDSFGHIVGDEVLKHIVDRLAGATRPYDVIGRYGGEEFVIILPNCCLDEALKIGERVRAEVSGTRMRVDGHELTVTISAGISEARPESDVTSLLREADAALYRAKLAGRDQVFSAICGVRVPPDSDSQGMLL